MPPGPQRVKRSKAGCLACRQTRIKCDEVHPVCSRCQDRSIQCQWPGPSAGPRRHRNPRPVSSCVSCRQRKARCERDDDSVGCNGCRGRNESCQWTSESFQGPMDPSWEQDLGLDVGQGVHVGMQEEMGLQETMQEGQEPDLGHRLDPPDLQPSPAAAPLDTFTLVQSHPAASANIPPQDLTQLVKLYFATAHHFGYLSFVHEADYWDLSDKGRAPEALTMLMAAHALRFGGPATSEQLQKADQWVAETGDRLIAQVFNEFGAVELMEVVLCHTYDFLTGRYSRGMVMAGMAARMMTFLRLHELDEWPRQAVKPLLSRESLRRLAWSVWFLDATIDGGNFGSSAIQEEAFTIQLPCDDKPFLLHKHVPTEGLIPKAPCEALDISAHLIRGLCARQALAQTQSRIARGLIPADLAIASADAAERKARLLLDSMPSDLAYSRALYHVYRDRKLEVVHLHVLRFNCLRHTSHLRMEVAKHHPDPPRVLSQERRGLVSAARDLSRLLSDSLSYEVVLDPQIAMHAYNGIEILLFQPARHFHEHSEVIIGREEIREAIKPLIQIVRNLSSVCSLVSLMYPEAINRLVLMGHVEDLTNEDIMVVLQKVHCFTDADKEFDWTESFWRYEIFLSRRQRAALVTEHDAQSPEDALQEIPSFSPAPSPIGQLLGTSTLLRARPDPMAIEAIVTTPSTGHDAISRLHNLFATRQHHPEVTMLLPLSRASPAPGTPCLPPQTLSPGYDMHAMFFDGETDAESRGLW